MRFSSETMQERLHELEQRKRSLADTIAAERTKATLAANQQGVKAFYERFLKANLDDLSIREALTEYFLDKVVYEPGKVTIYSNYYDSPPDGLFSPLTLKLRDKDCVPEDVLALESGDDLDFRAAECEVQGFSHFALRSTIWGVSTLSSYDQGV